MRFSTQTSAAALAGAMLVSAATTAVGPTLLRPFTFTSAHMGTEFRITLYADNEARASAAAGAAFERIAALETILSDYRDDSELMRLCRHAPGAPVRISDDLFRVLAHAQRIAHVSGGAFDPTVGPLTRLWRRARRINELPAPEEIDSARHGVGYEKLTLDAVARTATLQRSNMRLDLGGIGKGFAADEAVVVLQRHEIERALIAAGGDIATLGAPPDADVWTVTVEPLAAGGAKAVRVHLRDAAVSTSGDREQWLEPSGIRYSHIIDARTGWPVVGRSSVTVVAGTATDSDALATAVAVLGPEDGMELVESVQGAAAFVQRARGERVETVASRRWHARAPISVSAPPQATVSGRRVGTPLLSPPPAARSFQNRPSPRSPR